MKGMSYEGKDLDYFEDFEEWTNNTALADSGTTTHIVVDDEGMFDWRWCDEDDNVGVGGDQEVKAIKLGKWKGFAVQTDGTKSPVVLENVKQCPAFGIDLVAIMALINSGWDIENVGRLVYLTKGDTKIVFDRILMAEDGFLTGVELIPDESATEHEPTEKGKMRIHCQFTVKTGMKDWDMCPQQLDERLLSIMVSS